jgi:single-stranded-DNA-specific exonuclease
MQLKWLYEESNKKLIDQLLETRGKNRDQYKKTIDDLPDDLLMADVEKAVKRIISALYSNEKIVIFGHDDPDGVTSTYLIFDFLTSCGFQNHYYYIPNRLTDHHGVQDNFVDYVKEIDAKLVITVDNGISSKEKVEEISATGVDVIITDHHMFDEERMPQVFAVINPKRQDCQYPYKMLAGVGVALILVRALAKEIGREVKNSYYYWTAVGSLADRVPMTGENWIIVRHVLDNWDSISGSTFDYLTSFCNPIRNNFDKMNFINYSYRLIANGRDKGGIHHGLRFLIHQGRDKFSSFSTIQTEKKTMEKNIADLKIHIDRILHNYDGNGIIYFDHDEIPYPLIGTCATFIVNKIMEPVLMLKEKEGTIFCEGRSSEGFSILDAFKYCEEALIQYGGHVKAAGFSMEKQNLDRFKKLYYEYFQLQKDVIKENKFIQADAVIDISEIDHSIKNEIDFMLPFGQENPEPTVLVKNYQVGERNIRIPIENIYDITIKPHVLYDVMCQLTNNGQIKVLDVKYSDEN